MANAKEIVRLAIDARRGVGDASKYSASDCQASLREALIELNGGSTKLNAKTMRGSRAQEMYSIIEEVIQVALNDYWTNNELVNRICDYRNVALGDELDFYIPDRSLFAVATLSEGNTGIRRQRLSEGRYVTVPLVLRGIKIYEEMNRVLAGRVDFNNMIDRAVSSMAKDSYERIMDAWSSIGAAELGDTYVPTATGTYNEDTLLDLIAHVESETQQKAVIYGTQKALRTVGKAISLPSDQLKDDMYNMGYAGKFYGTDCIRMRQFHKQSTTEFGLDDKTLYVMASEDRPIKYVTAGEGLIIDHDPSDNADLTYSWMYTERSGVGIAISEQFAKYKFA